MRFSPLVDRIRGEGAEAWAIHGRAQDKAARGENVIFLSIGEPDSATPAPVVAAAKASLDAGRTQYADIVGEPALRAAIAAHHARLNGMSVDPDHVVVVAGAQCGMFAAALCLFGPGDEVLVPEPYYVTYPALIGASGAALVPVATDPARGFHVEPAALRAALTPRTRGIVLTTPHNPTGAVLRREELEAVAAICRERDLWLLSDEVYATLVYEGEHVSPATLPGMAERTVTVSSLSKSHAMTGWRVGWAVGPPAFARHLSYLVLCMLYGSPTFVQDAAVTALRLPDDELAAMRRAYGRRRALVQRALADVPGVRPRAAEGGMFALLDVRGSGLAAVEFADRLLDATGVCVLPADAFGPSASGHLRMSLGVADAVLEEACRRIARFAATG